MVAGKHVGSEPMETSCIQKILLYQALSLVFLLLPCCWCFNILSQVSKALGGLVDG